MVLGTALQFALVLSASSMASTVSDDGEFVLFASEEPADVPPLESPMLFLGPPVYLEDLEQLALCALLMPLRCRRRMGASLAQPKAKKPELRERVPWDQRAPVAPALSQESSTRVVKAPRDLHTIGAFAFGACASYHYVR